MNFFLLGTNITCTGRGLSRGLVLLVWFQIFLGVIGCGSPNSTPVGAVVGRAGRWDYSPSVIQTGQIQQFWWCGRARNPKTSQDTDTILYESIDLVSGKRIGPTVALAETPGTWDAAYTCNPQVVPGKFSNPFGDGQTFTYALYYVGTDNVAGSQNAIGVAFSNDGALWKKYPSPVIATTNLNGYGAAQPVPYNSDGKQSITLFYEDDAPPLPPNHHWEATSSDGIHFTTGGLLTTNGLEIVAGLPAWSDMAFNPSDGYWYATFNLPNRPSVTTGGVMEDGQYGIQLYRIPKDDLLIGKTGWQILKTIDTNMTDYESLFLAGLLRDGNGNLYEDSTKTIKMFPSFSNAHVPWNAKPISAANTAPPDSWDIGSTTWSPNDSNLYDLKRYDNGGSHWVTSGWVDTSVFTLEQTLGQVYTIPRAGATVPLYGCKMGAADQFVSLDSGCEGQYVLGLNGYIYNQAPPGQTVVAIYRCFGNSGHFVSTDPMCEGSQTDELLGYILPGQGSSTAGSNRRH
jgi:hypothetical protein